MASATPSIRRIGDARRLSTRRSRNGVRWRAMTTYGDERRMHDIERKLTRLEALQWITSAGVIAILVRVYCL